MIIPYKEGNPMVRIEVRCIKGDKNYDAYLDTGAGRTLIPEDDAIKLVTICLISILGKVTSSWGKIIAWNK
jgi:predicted aspartyl protease